MAKYIVSRSDGTPIPGDEPCFVIRAQDKYAPAAVLAYWDLVAAAGEVPKDFEDELNAHYGRIVAWQRTHRFKVPD